MSDINNKYKKLKEVLKKYGKFAVAFSGGVDSSFILHTASAMEECDVLAVTFHSELHYDEEIEYAGSICEKLGIRHMVLEMNVLNNALFKNNPVDRCYHCKKLLFSELKEVALAEGYKVIFDGTNFDDQDGYRPGMKALRELDVKSPLMKAGLKKADIRALSKEFGYEIWEKPSIPCLATRFPYHSPVTRDNVDMIKKGEEFLKEILKTSELRLRLHGDIARIEIKKEDFSKIMSEDRMGKVTDYLRGLGILYVTLDLEGLVSGSMDKVLKERNNGQ